MLTSERRPSRLQRSRRAPWLVLGVLLLTPAVVDAQEAPFEHGLARAGLLLRQLEGVKRVLMIGAHPDDEDTALLAALARGMGAETAYLSLTRGDGGQNLIGPELDEGLGVVRTGELVSARSLDGGLQFFTRAFDYGFSKSAEEAFSNWPREELLHDVVWVIRRFRPHVIVSVFGGTPADGHGQHQAAGILAVEAFDAAGDPARFPEQVARGVDPWQPAGLYRHARRDAPTLEVQTGRYDPLLGRSHHQLAMESRSRHRSQDMGVPRAPGAHLSSLVRVRTAGGTRAANGEEAQGLFAGVDTTLAGLAEGLPEPDRAAVLAELERYRTALHEAGAALGVTEPWKAAPPLARALGALSAMEATARRSRPAGTELVLALHAGARGKTLVAREALLEAAGVVVDVRVADDLLVPGEPAEIEVQLWNGGPYSVTDARPLLRLPEGWELPRPEVRRGAAEGRAPWARREQAAAEDLAEGAVPPGEVVRWTYRVTVPETHEPSRLYYLERPRDGELYRWPDDPPLWGLPADPPLVTGGAALSLTLPSGREELRVAVEALRPAEYVGVDKASGEFRRPVLVVPAVSLAMDPGGMAWPVGLEAPRAVTVSLRSQRASGPAGGTLSLEAPPGWRVEPASAEFALEGEGASSSFTFQVWTGPGTPAGRYALRAVARTAEGREYDEGFRLLEYPHIAPVALFRPARTAVTVVPARVAEGLRVGYVMGSGDAGPDALRQLGAEVELLGPRDLEEGDLSRFGTIVLGVRAYETRPDLAAANERVLDFARGGGTVVVQYNKYEYPAGGFAPYPVDIDRPHDRVTDEDAAVRVLDPEAPAFTTPNRITAEDFEGWVTERGLYFLGSWDERYVPLLEMADPGEEPTRGALLVAPLGEGLYVYTGLSFFRQLEAGVPGAYRLFANLVSLGAEAWHRHAADGGRR